MPEDPKNQLSKSQSIASQFFVTGAESKPKDPPKPSEKMVGGCSDLMAKAGLPNPKHCQICGLGPCVNKPGSFMRSPDPEAATGSFSMKVDPAMGNSFSIMSTRINDRYYSEDLLSKIVEEDARQRARQREREQEEMRQAQDRYPRHGRNCLLVGGPRDGRMYVIHEGNSLCFPGPVGSADSRYVLLIEEGPLVILYWAELSKTDALMLLMQGYDGISKRR